MSRILTAAAPVLALALLAGPVHAQGKKSNTVVKAEAKADKVGADGSQTVTVTLTIDKGWHLYANPVGNEDLLGNQVTVSITGKAKLDDVKIDYPAGKLVKDPAFGDYRKYEGEVKIKATVRRAKGDASALDVRVKVQACDTTTCLLPGTITLSVP